GETAYYQALIAETGEGKAVGFALYFFTFSTFVGKPTLKLEDLFVLPAYRGQGLGRRLLAELAVIARERDCGRMEWDVLDWNEPAIRFYQSLNAAPLSEWITYRLLPPDIEELSKMTERNG
ncbi:MAG: GNAT family N-acetyltransferase, partial [Calditrichaeota bacterium]|nr:GNAT family N-acetyltransferase [Calditrichota bacterium]